MLSILHLSTGCISATRRQGYRRCAAAPGEILVIFRLTHNGTNKKNTKMQCFTSINKNLIASNNRDIFYNLHSLVLLSPTGTLKASCYWELQGWDDGERKRGRGGDGEKGDKTNGPFISKLHKHTWGLLLLKLPLSKTDTLWSSSSSQIHDYSTKSSHSSQADISVG